MTQIGPRHRSHGGGVGIPYTPDEYVVDLDNFAEVNVNLFKEKLEDTCLLEGRL